VPSSRPPTRTASSAPADPMSASAAPGRSFRLRRRLPSFRPRCGWVRCRGSRACRGGSSGGSCTGDDDHQGGGTDRAVKRWPSCPDTSPGDGVPRPKTHTSPRSDPIRRDTSPITINVWGHPLRVAGNALARHPSSAARAAGRVGIGRTSRCRRMADLRACHLRSRRTGSLPEGAVPTPWGHGPRVLRGPVRNARRHGRIGAGANTGLRHAISRMVTGLVNARISGEVQRRSRSVTREPTPTCAKATRSGSALLRWATSPITTRGEAHDVRGFGIVESVALSVAARTGVSSSPGLP